MPSMSVSTATSKAEPSNEDSRQLVKKSLESIEVENELLYQSLYREEGINQYDLQIATNRKEKDALHDEIVNFYNSVHHQVRAKEQSDTHGIGKVSSKVSDFAKWTKDFFETYSGFAEIVRGIHNNFGAIAYGTFAVFLVVAQSKRVRQEQIQAILNELGVWLPRIKVFRSHDWRHPRLMSFVLDIYMEIVHFFQYATKFLCSSRSSRAWQLISPKSQKELRMILDKVKEKTKQLLEELIVRIYEQNDTMAAQIASIEQSSREYTELTKKKARDLHQSQMQRVAQLLGLGSNFDTFIDAMISYCDGQDYQAQFKFQRKAAFPPVRLQQISLEDLNQRDQYQNWMNAPHSSVLLLGGENMNISIPQSWLSPVSTKFLRSLEHSDTRITVFHSINGARSDTRYQSPEHEVLLAIKSILYQLLNRNSSLCQKFCENFSQASSPLDLQSINSDQVEEHIDTWVQILSETIQLGSFEVQSLFIILDGLEQLSAPAPQTLLEGVLYLLDECNKSPIIKILAICSTMGLSNIRNSNDTKGLRYALGQGGNTQMMKRVFADLFWDQSIWKDDLAKED